MCKCLLDSRVLYLEWKTATTEKRCCLPEYMLFWENISFQIVIVFHNAERYKSQLIIVFLQEGNILNIVRLVRYLDLNPVKYSWFEDDDQV